MSGKNDDGNGEEGGEEEGGPTDQKEEDDADTRSRLHEPPDNQPSQLSTTSLPAARPCSQAFTTSKILFPIFEREGLEDVW